MSNEWGGACCKQERLRADLVNEKTVEFLKEISFDEDAAKLYSEVLRDVFKEKVATLLAMLIS